MKNNIYPAFIDFEASSLDLIASYPIEVGICMPDGKLHSWLIKPHVLWRDWSESAEQIHGISRDRLKHEGRPISEVAHALNKLLAGQVFCDAWTFDSFWLHRLFKTARLRPEFQLESISMLLDSDQIQHWSDFRRAVIGQLGLPVHRAANDALILHKTWEEIMGLSSTPCKDSDSPYTGSVHHHFLTGTPDGAFEKPDVDDTRRKGQCPDACPGNGSS